ncbi:hypothetical protein KGQ24_01170 [Patescibacteria group bacterium]|nr:hypothetical protein [Patescibacteria group bacterium]
MAARRDAKGKSAAKSLMPPMNNQTQSGVFGGDAINEEEVLSEEAQKQRNAFLWCVAQIALRAEAVSADDIAALIDRNQTSLYAITGLDVMSVTTRPGERLSIRIMGYGPRWTPRVAEVFAATEPVMENQRTHILQRTLSITGEHPIPSATPLVS